MVDFSNITACGGDCSGCGYFRNRECGGCSQNGGKCVKMWENGCEICSCCERHNVKFCGLCEKFPCEWLKKVMTWEEGLTERLGELKKEYFTRMECFSPRLSELWEKIGNHGVMALSTCYENRVTSRSMSVVVSNGRFYCQTDENYLKYKQISKKPNVALCFDNFSVEGICQSLGKPLEHDFFINALKAYFPNAAERWSGGKNECLLEISPALISSWIYEEDKPYKETWDFRSLRYHKNLM